MEVETEQRRLSEIFELPDAQKPGSGRGSERWARPTVTRATKPLRAFGETGLHGGTQERGKDFGTRNS